LLQGCQIFLGTKYESGKNIPNVRKMDRHLSLQDPAKFTQIWIFGLKTNHLATLG
jgi:hypothetical protein